MSLLDVDPQRSAALRNMAAHLGGPFAGGAAEAELPLVLANGAWSARVDWVSRQPVLLVELRTPLAEHGLTVSVTVTPDGAPAVSSALDLAPFTEAGASLPGWIAAPGPASDTAPPFSITVSVAGLPAGTAVGDAIAVRVVEGLLGRLLYAIGTEKPRLRRQMREMYELRRLSFYFDESLTHRRMANALDRLGTELAVPRFADQLTWDAANRRPASRTAPEPNESYRQRLELYRPFLLPTRSHVERVLRNYTGAEAATVSEPNSEFVVALQLVSAPDDTPRHAFLDWLRAAHLLQPGGTIPPARLLPSDVRAAQSVALARITAAFAFPAGSYVAPQLVEVLDRVARCRAALGVTRPWKVLHAQDDAGGSRYELGLGVELEVPPAAELDRLVTQLQQKTFAAGTDPVTLALFASVASQPSATDPLGRWLLAPCGARTVHASVAGVFVSHVPMFGAVLARDAAPNTFQARFEAPGDPGPNAVLWYGLRDLVAAAAGAGIPAWTALAAPADATARAAASLPAAPLVAAIQAAGLRTATTTDELARSIAALAAMPPELIATLSLAPALSAGLIANDATAVQQLTKLVGFCTGFELGSVLPLLSGANVLLVVGAIPLPGAATLVNTERLAFRWYVVGITGIAGKLSSSVGARSAYAPPPGATAAAPSLSAVVAVSLARSDRDDPRDRIPPYSARIDLPPGTLIDLATYERVMNFLERAGPVGVVLDTQHLRAAHVDPGALGHAVALTGRLAHTFREFQQHRHRGAVTDDTVR